MADELNLQNTETPENPFAKTNIQNTETPENPFAKTNTEPSSRFLNFNDLSNPYRLDNGDNPATVLVADLLTSENYLSWSRSMRRALRAKNKLGFVNGDFLKPTDITDPLYDTWERCNDLVVSWIQNSVSLSVKTSLAFIDSARDMWMELQDRYTQPNGPRIFQLKKEVAGLMQENDSISVYYGKLKVLWDELAIYDPMPDCHCGKLKVLIDRQQRDYVIQFLMGLNDAYSNVRDQIMLLDLLPPVNRIFSMIQQQETHHKMTSNTPSPESMAFFTQRTFADSKSRPKQNFSPKQNRPFYTHCRITGHVLETCFKVGNAEPPTCNHCHMMGHIAEKCYKKHGYPPNHKLNPANRKVAANANVVLGDFEDDIDDTVAFTKAQYQQLLSLIQPNDSSSHSANQAQTVLKSVASASNATKMSGPFVLDHDWDG
ncbi:hypothetical protein CJ030_MR4G025289 [Morella rubra]|uniref:Retrotransposon Copia-like N-terminal domain-containing protein n=1 Tax=Morella rubra TaxID=262757 RepID=A0A6A1VTV8_9ROSI|nr:hypothetical protein CJ030_MR4G025289 [Morella rubra]